MSAVTLAEEAKQIYESGEFIKAADLFAQAAEAYRAAEDAVNAAEMLNNQSVAFLQAGKAVEALKATDGTETVFEQAGDLRRQGIAIANRARALESLKKYSEAMAEYNRAADVFERAGEGDLHSIVRKATAELFMKRGYIANSQMEILDSIRLAEKPTFAQRILKFMMRLGLFRPQ